MENTDFIRRIVGGAIEVRDGSIRKGTSTGLVYLPVRYIGRKYTLILWDDEDKMIEYVPEEVKVQQEEVPVIEVSQ